MKKSKLAVLVAVCAVLASCLVISGCVTFMEGSVQVRSSKSDPAPKVQKAPPPQRTGPAPVVTKAPKTKRETKKLVLNAGQTYLVTAAVNSSAGKRAECESSNSGIIVKESETIVGASGKGGAGTLRFTFRAMRGGSTVITLREYKDGYLTLIREIHVVVQEPEPKRTKSGNTGGRKASQ